MKKACILLILPALAIAQGWTQLSNTTFVSGSVCVPNNYGAGSGYPSFAWADECFNLVGNWNGAIADTKRNRLIMWGMGHAETPGNELYALDLATPSAGAVGTSNGSAIPAIRRLNNPAVPRDYPDNSITHYITNADGSPIARHSYGSMVYLPKSDRMFAWAGQEYDGNYAQSNNLWLLQLANDMSAPSWTAKTPAGIPSGIIWANCVLDTTSTDEAVYCIGGTSGNHFMWRYNVTTDAWTNPVAYGGWTVGSVLQSEGVPVVDPDRRLIYHVGYGTNFAAGKFYSIMMDSPYTSVDLTSVVVGCAPLMAAKYPGLVYDPSLRRIVGYPDTGNSVYLFDPQTMQCVAQAFANGPTSSTQTTAGGLFGRFSYFPALGKYVVVNNHAANAYTLQINATPTHGLGSSTLTCVDRDGDGYGAGPGCSGADADDQDVAVHTGAQLITKWSTLKLGLAHLGYAPTIFWYLSPTGSDAATCSDTDGSTHAATPCATWAHINSSVACGDIVLYRAGSYTFRATPPNCTAGAPITLMAYPGETVTFSAAASGIDGLNKSYLGIDGFTFTANETAGGGVTNLGSWPGDLDTSNHITIRHINSSGNKWGLVIDTSRDVTVEDSVLHDSAEQHGIYSANHDGYGTGNVSSRNATNQFFRNLLLYKNGYTGIQLNGRNSNAVIDSAIAYNNDIAGFSWETGVNHSILRNSLAFGNASNGLAIYSYQDWCTAYDPGNAACPYDQNYNLIDGFTCYGTGYEPFTGVSGQQAACIQVANAGTTRPGDLGHLTVRNSIFANYEGTGYGPIQFDDADKNYLSTSTFTSNIFWHTDGAHTDALSRGTVAYGNFARATCSQAAGWATVSGCSVADPAFVAASNTFWNSPASFNFRLLGTSPAVTAGAATVGFDLGGASRSPSAPSLGAYEYLVVGAPSGSVYTGVHTGRR